jgi:Ca-activated chloride channel family protein
MATSRRVTATIASALAALVCLAAQEPKPPAQAEQKQPQTRLRSGVDLVPLSVTVMEGTRYVSDLEESDFEVFEDGAKQAIAFFSRTQQPIALAILLDTSASMNERLPTAQEAAIGFARRMRPDDVMEVIDFDSRPACSRRSPTTSTRSRKPFAPPT